MIAQGSRFMVTHSKLKFGSSKGSSLGTQEEGGREKGAKQWLLPMVLTSTGLLQKQSVAPAW